MESTISYLIWFAWTLTILPLISLAGSLPNQIVWNKDGAEMSYIPASSFEMGDHFGESQARELPVHTVTVDGCYMDKTEVTVRQFKAFLANSDYNWTGSWTSVDQYSPTDNHPMIYVNWYDAMAYCEWAGKRLPTEAEWEKAARGGLQGKRYSWGNQIDDTNANYGNNVGTTTVAGSYPANGYGLYDVAGNVWEWCADWWQTDYYTSSPANNPLGPDTGSSRVLRGGRWYSSPYDLRVSNRDYYSPAFRRNLFGFRCVSGLNFTTGSSAGGIFTSGKAAPLLPRDGQMGSNWFSDLSLDATDYTWSTVATSSAILIVRLFVQPLGGIDTSGWDFSAVSTVDALTDQLGSDGLNLTESADYQLLVVGLNDNRTTETLDILLSELAAEQECGAYRLPNQIVWNKDGAEMAYVPAGSFEMGDALNETESWMASAQPVHTVALDGFYMDKTEVTVGQFKAFLANSDYNWTGSWASVNQYSPTGDHPMIYVNWDDAVAYADWAGKRLPTEAEWEKAARGDLDDKRYPWGDEINDTKANYNANVGKTTVAGSYPANGYDLYDVAGNVWEWCADRWDQNYYDSSPANSPLGPDTGSSRVLRGGSWYINTNYLRVAFRYGTNPPNRLNNAGFRCVSGLDFTTDPSEGGVFISGEAAPLLPSAGQMGFNWFSGLSLDATDYTWSTVDSSNATLTVRLFVQPLGGIDANAWDFSAISTVGALANQLNSGCLNLTEGTDYQLLVVAQDGNGTPGDSSDDLTETQSVLWSRFDLSPPAITSQTLAADNGYLELDFSEAVYGDRGASMAVDATPGNSFTIVASGNLAMTPTITGLFKMDGSALVAGNSVIRIEVLGLQPADGTETITLTVKANKVYDANGNTIPADQVLAAIPLNANAAPTAYIQSVTTEEDMAGGKAITLSAQDVDKDTLTYLTYLERPEDEDLVAPAHGSLSGTSPAITYTPEADYSGTDTFTFKANDGKVDSNLATVTITVNAVNDPPVTSDQTLSVGDLPTQVMLMATDVDNDDSTLIFSIYDAKGNITVAAQTSVAVVVQTANGTLNGTLPNLVYVPNPGYYGADSFTFKASDGSADSINATVAITINPLPNQFLWNKDEAQMAYVPAGSFKMGDALDNMSDALPVYTVTLDGFYMDKTEVTVGQFKAFLADSDYNWTGSWDGVFTYSPTDDHPMIYVNWHDAMAYCKWANKRLPTEAEWEKAARGGLQGKRYPWGNEVDGNKANYDGNVGKTTVTGSYSANGYGLYDVAGNVWEWCADLYGSYTSSSATTLPEPDTGSSRVLRGGGWSHSTSDLWVACRYGITPDGRYSFLGFRCVSDLP